jgi:hypothetical protein
VNILKRGLDMSQTRGYLSPKLEVRAAPKKGGFAVFCIQAIEKDELLAIWSGEILSLEQVESLSAEERSHTVQIDEGFFLGPAGPADASECINHSCNPNAGIRGQISLVAMRPIDAGEEITFDYAMTDGTAFDEFPCACGALSCRGRVSGGDWQLPGLWTRYRGYFSAYLQRRIDALRDLQGDGHARDRS